MKPLFIPVRNHCQATPNCPFPYKLRIDSKYGDLKQRVLAVINFFKELS